jgi:hypothetical protein
VDTPSRPGRGRCVSLLLSDQNRRYIGKSQSKRPAKKDATAAAPPPRSDAPAVGVGSMLARARLPSAADTCESPRLNIARCAPAHTTPCQSVCGHGRGRCVPIFRDKHRRYIGKSQSKRAAAAHAAQEEQGGVVRWRRCASTDGAPWQEHCARHPPERPGRRPGCRGSPSPRAIGSP